MQCDLCGKEDTLFNATIEGTSVRACKSCASFGTVKGQVAAPLRKKEAQRKQTPIVAARDDEEVLEYIREDYATVIRNAREKKGLKQEDFAKMLREKESVIHKLETGSYEPSIPLANKLEKILNVKLVRVMKGNSVETGHTDLTGPRTIGDIVQMKK
ncbi:MAG: multiprotein bridging factor aMBF1 [Candidatus Woesearchaeota archaeon]